MGGKVIARINAWDVKKFDWYFVFAPSTEHQEDVDKDQQLYADQVDDDDAV